MWKMGQDGNWKDGMSFKHLQLDLRQPSYVLEPVYTGVWIKRKVLMGGNRLEDTEW